jgi:hypothetical protein
MHGCSRILSFLSENFNDGGEKFFFRFGFGNEVNFNDLWDACGNLLVIREK